MAPQRSRQEGVWSGGRRRCRCSREGPRCTPPPLASPSDPPCPVSHRRIRHHHPYFSSPPPLLTLTPAPLLTLTPPPSLHHYPSSLNSSFSAPSFSKTIIITIFLLLLLLTWGVMIQGREGRQARTCWEKDLWGTSCSNNNTSFSVSLSPTSPSLLTR